MTASAPPVRLDRLAQLALTVRDLDRAVAFYRDTLGLPFLFTAPPALAFFDCGGVRLLLGAEPSTAAGTGAVVYFHAADIQATAAALAARGVKFARPPHLIARLEAVDVWLAEFADPDGNQLALMSEVSR
ncbi:MAG TPA: VOC family protein [Gemmatimonadales bacterium]|nr:VOC family protein [Gemmatimonadales bacterium]